MGEGKEKKEVRVEESQSIRDSKTENKLRVDGGWEGGEGGGWVLRRAPFGMSTGCCMETNLTINFIYWKKKKTQLSSLRTVQLLLLPKPASLKPHRYCSREHCPPSRTIR